MRLQCAPSGTRAQWALPVLVLIFASSALAAGPSADWPADANDVNAGWMSWVILFFLTTWITWVVFRDAVAGRNEILSPRWRVRGRTRTYAGAGGGGFSGGGGGGFQGGGGGGFSGGGGSFGGGGASGSW
jgi:uncharacterized membrane protein YgcG